MKDIAQEMGVRTGVPFRELTAEERDIVFHGPAVKKNIIYQNKTSGAVGGMDFTYFNATYTVENALSKVKDEKGMKRVEKFLKQGICPDCGALDCPRRPERRNSGEFPWTGRRPPSPPESASGCSWPGPSATAPPGFSMCWTSPPLACTRPILWASPA